MASKEKKATKEKTSKQANQPAAAKKRPAGLPEQLDQWVFYGFLAIAITLPLAISRITFDQFDIAKIFTLRILTLVTLGIWAWRMFVSAKKEIRWSKVDFVVLGFLFVVLLSTITSIHIPTAIHGKFKRYEGLLTFINYGILYFLAIQTFTSLKRLSQLSRTIALVGGVVALYGVMQYVGLDPLKWATLPFEERRSFSTFGNPDLLAGFMALVAPIAAAEFLKARGTRENVLMFVILNLILASLLWSFTRGAWIAAVIAFVVFTVAAAKEMRAGLKKSLIGIAITLAVLTATATLPQIITGKHTLNLVERVASITKITEGSAGTRLEIWKSGLEMIKDRPLLGFGPDTFRLSSERYETYEYVKMGGGMTVADNAHNYVIQLAAGLGIPGMLLFLALIAAVMFVGIRHMRALSGDERLVHAGLIAAAVGYFVHLLFGLSISGSSSVFWIILGALVAVAPLVRTARIDREGTVDYAFKGALVMAVSVSLVAAYFGVTMYIADNHYANAIKSSNAGLFDSATSHYKRSIELYKNGRYYDGYGVFLERIGVYQSNRTYIQEAIMHYETAVAFEPNEADHYIFLAGAKAKLATGPDDPVLDQAIASLNKALEVRPNAFSARIILANIYMYKGKYKEMIEPLNFVLSINPKEKASIQMMAKAQDNLGNKAEAKRYYELVLAAKPEDKEAQDALKRLSAVQ